MKKDNQKARGFVLITVLLFLAVLTILAMGAMETGLLESKMGNYYGEETAAFYKAETNLAKNERAVLQGEGTAKAVKIVSYCGVDFYLVSGGGAYHGADMALQSTVAKLDHSAHCEDPPKVKEGRQSWLVIAEDR